jgi:hypothetical protein
MIAALGFLLAVAPLSAIPAAADTTPAVTAPAPAAASVDVAQSSDASDSFADVPTTHWAYQAVEELADDGYIKGYPDGTFKGNRPLTRYEMAALVERALSAIKSSIVAGQDVNQRDINDLKKLMTAFAAQLKDVQAQLATVKSQQAATQQQVSALQQQQAALKAEADATRVGLAQNKGGLNFDYKPATSFIDAEYVNGPYARPVGAAGTLSPAVLANGNIPAYYGATPGVNNGTNFASGTGSGQNSIFAGPHSQGISEFGVKPSLQGSFPDGHFSYQVRLAYVAQQATPEGLTASTPAYCTAQGLPASYPCVYQDAKSNNANIPITLDRVFIQWSSIAGNQGFGALLGKISTTGNTGSRNVNPTIGYGKLVGGAVFYMDPSPSQWLEAAFGVGQTDGVSSEELAAVNASSPVCTAGVQGFNSGTITNTNTGLNGYCNGNATENYGYIQLYNKGTGTSVGINNRHVNQYPGTWWDAGAGLCATSAANQTAGTAAAIAIDRASCQGATPFPLLSTSGAYIVAQGAANISSVWVSQVFGPHNRPTLVGQFDYDFRSGNDPFTGTAFGASGNAYAFTVVYGSKGNIGWGRGAPTYATIGGTGLKDSNNIFLTAIFQGVNSLQAVGQGPNGAWEGVGYNTGLGNFNGTQFEAAQYAHWFTNNMNLNIAYVHQGTLPGITLPVGGTGCPGCYLNSLNSNIVLVSTWMSF